MCALACGDDAVAPAACDALPAVADTDNPPTEAGTALGGALFFDTGLSANGAVACATCHDPARAFTDGLVTSTLGVTGNPLARNTPTLVTAAWSTSFFADGGAKNLESQALGPLTALDEMGNADLVPMMAYVTASYAEMFADFGEPVTIGGVLRALAQFERTLRPERCDTPDTGEGARLFANHCASCHPAPLYTDESFHNNGLDAEFSSDDEGIALGRGRVTLAAADIGAFKTPTLRSVSLTAPYMHDGRFPDLASVIDHYSEHIVMSATLAHELPSGGFGFDASERAALVEFLEAL